LSVAPSVSRQVGADGLILSLAGDWIVSFGAKLEASAAALDSAGDHPHSAVFDFSGVARMDTAGAWLIDRARFDLDKAGVAASYRGLSPEYELLIREAGYRPLEEPKTSHASHLLNLLASVGESVHTAWIDFIDIVDYLGEIVSMWTRLAARPIRWRWTSVAYHLEAYSLRSVPIIALINFLVGAIVTQQGIFQLARFGASPYAVNLVGVLGLRELGVLMTSIMIAGRTGSAITAEIGSMNMRE
jgi:phospholipid/cholesterol/gamma-HCH transport system permease protein